MSRLIVRILLGAAFVGALALALWRFGPGRPARLPDSIPSDSTSVGVRASPLFFSDAEGERWVIESREMVEREGLHEKAAALIEALVEGPRGPGVATVPAATRLQQAYLLEDGVLVLDLSREFIDALAGGSRREEMAVGSLVRTMTANLPEVHRVRIVCQGPLVSAGGHLPLDRPLDPLDWP